MKKIAIIAVAALALMGCKKGVSGNSENSIQIVNVESDSTKYGIAVKMQDDSLQWIIEDGDTAWICIKKTQVLGSLSSEHRIAVLFKQGSKTDAKSVIDMTQLMGRWVEPDAVDEGMMQGMELQEGGAAASINSRANHYVSWRIYNGKLLLVNSLDGIVDHDAPEDTFYITQLSADSMRVTTTFSKHFYRRSDSKDDDVQRDYNMYVSPDAGAFDPEGDAPEGSENDDIPEFDKVF